MAKTKQRDERAGLDAAVSSASTDPDGAVSADVKAIFDRHWGAAAHRKTTVEEGVARIRILRDEWDD